MKEKTIEKKDLSGFIDSLLEEYQVFAPTIAEGIPRFDRISSSTQVSLDSPKLERSPKEVFFPQCETLFTYQLIDGKMTMEEPPALESERVLLFVRPCDVKALTLMDSVFTSWEPKDTNYLDKREKTIIVGRACSRPWSTCFCTSLGVDPFGKEGMDLVFEDIGDKYVVEALTERGGKIIDGSSLFKDAEKKDLENLKEVSKKATEAIRSELDVKEIEKKLKAIYDDSFWGKVSEKCVGCGVCSYLCPVCHCFDVQDEGTELKGKRVRIWDACQYPIFTLHASGHNPRTSSRERIRQRMMHKFSYFIENFGELACVGCGRCIKGCPGNMDIREVLTGIMATEAD
ncbi:MAG: 4Fe-4S dicluster domain-containing protein [Candidatus Bathyarchaeota archaeon]|nr:MAG: 4Fe-4S dicluster domain-containing protein [Candidatus Bathyarchaeota archaeon]